MCALYLLLLVPTSLMIPAYEANEESEHIRNTERIVPRGDLPTIALTKWARGGSAALYYIVAAIWQRLLRIEALDPAAFTRPLVPLVVASATCSRNST